MFFHQRFVPGLAIYSYIIGDEKSKKAAVIDPTRDVDDFIETAKREGLRIEHILETHVHADFVSGSKELKHRLHDKPIIHVSGLGGDSWTPPYADQEMHDMDEIAMGSIRLQALHTPGHTLEHISWILFDETRSFDTPWLAFTGDFLFVGDVGRPDLLGEEARKELAHQLYESVMNKLPFYPDFLEIFPNHGAGSLCGKAIGSRSSSTLGYERKFNPSLQSKPEEKWIKSLMDQMPISPYYFARMKKVNKEGPDIIGLDLPGQQRWSAKEVYDRKCENCLILDVRSKEAFAGGHIPEAINIPFGTLLSSWAGWVLPYDKPTLLILESPAQMREATIHLIRVGFEQVKGYLEGGFDAWQVSGYPVETLSTFSVHTLNNQLKQESSHVTVLDVRTEKEWNAGHIPCAIHIHGGKLKEQFEKVQRDKPVRVICGSGFRGSIAASFLKREGFKDVTNVLGGMSAWNAAGFPVVKESVS